MAMSDEEEFFDFDDEVEDNFHDANERMAQSCSCIT